MYRPPARRIRHRYRLAVAVRSPSPATIRHRSAAVTLASTSSGSLLLLLLFVGAMTSGYENVDYDGLLAKMARKSLVIDVRERRELAATGSLPDSVNIPLGELADDLGLSADAFQQKHGARRPDEEADEIVLSCMSGNRSRRAVDVVIGLGYKKVFNYTGGWAEWSVKRPSA